MATNINHTDQTSPVINQTHGPIAWRSYNDAIINASNMESASESEKLKSLYYAEKLGQFPVGIAVGGKEYNALAHGEIYKALPDEPAFAVINKPALNLEGKPKWEVQLCTNCSPPLLPSIADLLGNSSYARVLSTRQYEEISLELCEILNLDWVRFPQAGQAASRLLSGALLVNVTSRSIVLLNEVEVYGRGRMIDCHQEQMGVVKGVPKKTSVPSTIGRDHYKDVRPITLPKKDCQRLVIGSFTCDILVTSCVRLDIVSDAAFSVGGDTLNFEILEQDSHNIRIYVDSEQRKASCKISESSYSEATRNLSIGNLRQIRTKFDQLDSYNLTRCSGPLTKGLLYQPYTVFTIANSGNDSCAGFAAGHLFNRIGKAVITQGTKAVLTREDVEYELSMFNPGQEAFKPFNNIQKLFGAEKDKISIIGNSALNAQLEELAKLLSKKISDANQITIAAELRKLFMERP
ncbi:hypothetical protein BGX26_011576 [Mortierella sp. AD094]|nr:hypothetical protein BGX26_011576 [Mortierella sp. AD094]